MNTNEPHSPLRLLTAKVTGEKTGRKRTWIWAAVKSGTFPRPIKHGRSILFVESEVEDWIRARIADRDGTGQSERMLATEKELADALVISTSFLQKDRLLPTPRIPFIKLGLSVRYDIDEVRAALKATPVRGRKTTEASTDDGAVG